MCTYVLYLYRAYRCIFFLFDSVKFNPFPHMYCVLNPKFPL